MNDKRTEKEKYKAWVKAVNKCHEKGWICAYRWIFIAPGGTEHDLSAADLEKLDEIEEKGLFLR